MKGIFNKLYALFNINTRWLTIFLPVTLLGIFFLFLMINNVYTEIYDIERFSRAKQTIRSPITIENEQETERKTRETIQSVEDHYNISEEITAERVEYVEEIFDAIYKLDEIDIPDESLTEDDEVILTNQEKVQKLIEILSPEITEALHEQVFIQLIRLPVEDLKEGEKVLTPILIDTFNTGVRAVNIQSSLARVKQEIKFANFDTSLQQSLIELSEFAIVQNSFFDPESTMTAQNQAASSVEPVVIRAGEIIVREGQIITNEIYEELKLAGLLKDERNIYPVIGLVLLILLVISVIGHEMNLMAQKNKLDKGKVISIFIISVLVIALMKVVSLYTTSGNQLFFVVPVATGALLLKQLIQERLAIVLASLYAILGCIIFNGEIPGGLNVEAGVYFFFSQLAAIIFYRNVKDRLAIVKAGLGMALVNVIAVLLFIFLSFDKYALADIFTQSGFGIVSALLSAVLTIGLLPFFETSLGILSDIKLLSLASPNQPLLKKLLVESPGTYHHSIMVANLSETACEAIGANGLLARVGAYYHDIGKTVRPHYFIENQLSVNNPHDVIMPQQSADIIISHPYDGAELLKKHRIPKEIIDIAKQHHGTTLLKYFYHKEKKQNKYAKEETFRYPGPKPQTREAAVISICDSVEAAVRSFKEPTKKEIDEIVSSIVNDRLMDGQLDESPLTLKEIKVIKVSICETLKGIFHSRIQYPIKEAK